MVSLDLHTLYLRDLTVLGCTFQDDAVLESLLGYIERDEIRPTSSGSTHCRASPKRSREFMGKCFVGKLVLTPPPEPSQ